MASGRALRRCLVAAYARPDRVSPVLRSIESMLGANES